MKRKKDLHRVVVGVLLEAFIRDIFTIYLWGFLFLFIESADVLFNKEKLSKSLLFYWNGLQVSCIYCFFICYKSLLTANRTIVYLSCSLVRVGDPDTGESIKCGHNSFLKKCPLYGDVCFIECLPKSQLFQGGIPVNYTFLGPNTGNEWIEKGVTETVSNIKMKTEHFLS